MRVLAVCAAALIAAGCSTISSPAPLLTDSDGAAPFADGARYNLGEGDGSTALRFRQAGKRYDLFNAEDETDSPMRGVLFAAIPDTPEEDYVAQAQLSDDTPAASYAFLWRHGAGFRLLYDGRLIKGDADAMPAPCSAETASDCVVSSREDLLALYRRQIYLPYVVTGIAPPCSTELVPEGASASAPPACPQPAGSLLSPPKVRPKP